MIVRMLRCVSQVAADATLKLRHGTEETGLEILPVGAPRRL